MRYYVYIIHSNKSNKYYVGSTSNIARRISEHNNGKVISTNKRGPWMLRYSETFTTRKEAIKREFQIKRYKGGEAFKELMLINLPGSSNGRTRDSESRNLGSNPSPGTSK